MMADIGANEYLEYGNELSHMPHPHENHINIRLTPCRHPRGCHVRHQVGHHPTDSHRGQDGHIGCGAAGTKDTPHRRVHALCRVYSGALTAEHSRCELIPIDRPKSKPSNCFSLTRGSTTAAWSDWPRSRRCCASYTVTSSIWRLWTTTLARRLQRWRRPSTGCIPPRSGCPYPGCTDKTANWNAPTASRAVNASGKPTHRPPT